MLSPVIAVFSRGLSEDVFVADGMSTSFSGVTALTLITWDTIINLDDEIYFIWRGPNTWTKFMYLFLRYFPLFVQFPLLSITTSVLTDATFPGATCKKWALFQALSMEFSTIAAEVVLIIRVYALYNRQKLILWLISILFVMEVAVMLVALILTVPGFQFDNHCLIVSAPHVIAAYWISSLIFQVILLGLTLFQPFTKASLEYGERTLMYILVRDGLWAFAAIFIAMLLNTLMFLLNHTPLAGICYYWALSVMSLCGSHILLNLRRISPSTDHKSYSFFTTHFDSDIQPGSHDLLSYRKTEHEEHDRCKDVLVLESRHCVSPATHDIGHESIPMKNV